MAESSDNLSDKIASDATRGIAKASGDTGSVEQHPLPDRIEAARFAAANQGVARTGMGLRKAKIVPPGAV